MDVKTSRRVETPMPPRQLLKVTDIFDEKTGLPNVDRVREHFYCEGRLDESASLKIINLAEEKFRLEPNLVELKQPVVIVGDVHGQFYDLLEIFQLTGADFKHRTYLFLGDYVDRGQFGAEVLLYLYCLKIVHPNNVILLRGNHECRHLTSHFTFKRECQIKYSSRVYEACVRSFWYLPLCALVNKQLFCVHGGISPDLNLLSDVNGINRAQEPPSFGLMCDLLWSDPDQNYNETAQTDMAFSTNRVRGCSYYYTFSAVAAFLRRNSLLCVVRAHEAQDLGFRMYRSLDVAKKKNSFPSLISIFSAPNYLDVYQNKGAVIVYENDTMNTKQFAAKPHPYWLPNFLDVFSWSLPFVAEKVTELLLFIFRLNVVDQQQLADRREIIRVKLFAISRIFRMYTKIRERSESLVTLKGIAPSNMTDLNSLISISPADESDTQAKLLGNELKARKKLSLEEIKQLDQVNECLPQLKK